MLQIKSRLILTATQQLTYVKWYPMPNLFFRNSELPQHLIFPLLITAFRSASMSASSIKCVVNSITFPCLLDCSKDHICLLEYGSTPAVGSSRMMILGSPIIAIPTDSFLFWPPLRCFAKESACSVKSMSFKVFFTCEFKRILHHKARQVLSSVATLILLSRVTRSVRKVILIFSSWIWFFDFYTEKIFPTK